MKSSFQVSLVIPAYNNEKTIISQISACEKILKKLCPKYEIIVADDKSTDTTTALLKKYVVHKRNIHVIFNSKNLGIGENSRMLYNSGQYEYILFYSADGDWNPQDIKKLIFCCRQNNADMVIGVRNKKQGYTLYRKIISFFHNLFPIIFFGVSTIDAGGIKIIRKSLIQSITLVSKGQFFEAELIIRAKKLGFVVCFVPVQYKKMSAVIGRGGDFSAVMDALKDLFRLKFYERL